jgi:succinate dehydrogenase / fumarate reductase cytochrome b subunit
MVPKTFDRKKYESTLRIPRWFLPHPWRAATGATKNPWFRWLTGAPPTLHSGLVRTSLFLRIFMAEQASPNAPSRPLSPHLQIYSWPVTMMTSITHRLTGIALSVGTAFLAWWLIALASGPDAYGPFQEVAHSIIGQIILFGFVWSLAFHLLNGIRHLAWDLGYGFKVSTANFTGVTVIVLSILVAVGVFALGFFGKGGYWL